MTSPIMPSVPSVHIRGPSCAFDYSQQYRYEAMLSAMAIVLTFCALQP
jgi:hypothetical protein